jgi:hypothetical protein
MNILVKIIIIIIKKNILIQKFKLLLGEVRTILYYFILISNHILPDKNICSLNFH